jgi:chemotaxis protein histidine kinase CheA
VKYAHQLSLGGPVDQIKSQVDNLAELGDEQVTELQQAIVSEFESVESQDISPETVDAMTALADMLETVRGDLQRREAAAEELAAKAAEAASRVMGMGEDDMGEDMAPEEEVVPAEDMPEAPVAPMEEDEEMKTYAAESTEASATTEEVAEFSADPEDPAVETSEDAPTEQVEALEASTEAVEEFAAEEIIETTIEPQAQEEQAPVTAAAEESFAAPASHQPVIEVSEVAPVAITAGADIPGYTAGSTIANMYEVASAMEKRLHSLRRVNGGDGEQHIVASFSTAYPETRSLSTNAEENSSKIDAVVGPEALVASGGHSAPFEVRYDIFGFGTTERPVRDALPKFQADRGGIRYIVPPSLVSYDSGTVYNYDSAVGVWTAANDSAETPSPATKGSLTVASATETTVSTDAVTLQLQFGNLMTRAYPELISRHNELALIQHAREAELNLISKIGAGSTAVNAHVATTEAASLVGVARDFLVQVRKASAAYRSRHRLSVDTRLKAIVPAWIYDAMSADLALNMPGDGNLAVGRSEIEGYLSSIGVDLVPSLDLNSFGAQQGSAAKLLEFTDQFVWYLFAEGTFLFLDGGTLDLGIIRDSTLVGTNDYKMFIETFENVAKVGIESLAITTSISVNGVAAALRDTTGGATAAAIEE